MLKAITTRPCMPVLTIKGKSVKTNSGKGYFYVKGQRARITHSWASGAHELRYVIRSITKRMPPGWAKDAFRAGFFGRHINHGYYPD